MSYAEILFQRKVGDKDTLTYSVPENLKLNRGDLVKVKLRNRSTNGLVWKIHQKTPPFKTIPITEKISSESILPETQLSLLEWISSHYFVSLYQIGKLFIPKRVFEAKPFREKKAKDDKIICSAPKRLNKKQKEATKGIVESDLNNFLIHGVTGSGKTEVYTKIAKHYLEKDMQVLILVPEISLTPQTINYFQSALGEKAFPIHSKLSEGDRYRTWTQIKSGEAKLIIGSRSAIFSPFKNIGAIIVDEEHDNSYKQDSSPRYKTHKVIEKMQSIRPEIKVIFGSATPSIEIYQKLKKSTFHLDSRISGSELPEVEIVDLREEFKKQNYSIFSESLSKKIEQTLARNEQTILFVNRRGAASSVVCRDCGYTHKCQTCDIPLTYHARTLGNPVMICHHCGKITHPPTTCPECKSHNIRFLGIGTQRIESEIQKLFPNAKTLRADKDTTTGKYDFEKIYNQFKNHEADILIGTQMITKGLDIPKVSLVGVVLADIGLNIPDFHATEKAFQLLTQVAGRAGRSHIKGSVVIQTYSPDNLALRFAQTQNYEEFFRYEITQRKLLKNPPFSSLCKILVQNKNFDKSHQKAEQLERDLWKIARELKVTDDLEITLYPAYLIRLRDQYRHIVLIKSFTNAELLHKLLENLPKDYIMDANFRIDIDPINIT